MIIQELLERNADRNSISQQDGFTPLITTIRTLNEKNALKIIEILNGEGMLDFSKCDRSGQSPI